ncbi:MAG TPA: excinuclease ABC subunit UvrC [Candidatus Cloacimonetes bacterium]|nr:excinuclease ABC subunit UvrC [Candidatus Cloacimonadota bacterium]
MAKISQKIKEKLILIPERSGVYLMTNSSGKIIYIGKAKILKNRIRSYFTGTPSDNKTEQLIGFIHDFDYIITGSEQEALVLENNLIKKHKPKYNILLRDDKQYPFIKVTFNEPFPRIFVTRIIKKDKAKYFGPYTKVKSVRKTLRMLEWLFPIRTCTRNIPKGKPVFERACINFQLGKCPAPCIGKISQKEYLKLVHHIISFLKGKNESIINDLKSEMETASARLDFEKAAQIRDKIFNIQKLSRTQNMFFPDLKNRDVIGIYKEENKAAIAVLKILSGKLLNKEIYAMENVQGKSRTQIMEAFLKQYYSQKLEALPYRIIVQIKPDDFSILNSWLNKKLIVPARGELKELVAMAKENAFNYIEEQKLKYLRKSNRTIFPIKELKDKLKLKKLPRKMVCLDISTIQGSDTVSSVVYFENGKPKKKNYRHFIIKTVIGQDDFASMGETLQRYLEKVTKDDKPDLIVIDGGKGQLNAAGSILIKMNLKNIEILSLAKKLEEVFLPDLKNSIILPRSSSALRLLINIRDEAHRFAITFHRKRRSSRLFSSELNKIKGIGDEIKFLLLKEFGSVEKIKQAKIKEISEIKGIGIKRAEKILRELS